MPRKPSNAAAAPTRQFSRNTLEFLRELKQNNERAWFEANKHRYEADVLEPALGFIESMGPRIERMSPHFTAIAKRSGGSLMRVYRDTRFSRDKTPYKTNIGVQFRHELGRDVHAPGFYVHIEPDGCFLGAGIWHPESTALQRIRAAIIAAPDDWRRSTSRKRFRDRFELSGDRLARPPRGFAVDAPHIEDLKRKDFIAISTFAAADITEPRFAATVAEQFEAAVPLMRFLCSALELRF
jgi:uncharacterized protein (TIGR02453 family)